MAIRAKMLGREAVMRKLNKMVPEAEKELAKVQLEVAQEAASRIAARANGMFGGTGDYVASIQGDRLSNRPKDAIFGISETKDKNATGIFAKFTWRWLEHGTKNMEKRPHIFPTWRAYRKAARRKMANAVNKAVRKVMAK